MRSDSPPRRCKSRASVSGFDSLLTYLLGYLTRLESVHRIDFRVSGERRERWEIWWRWEKKKKKEIKT